mmetsp:Transcript_28143/g.45191  ORF Transcript_28143/g.45191 Transcript_28143/m.45191 type:complete len:209 (-) Transcript_28143:626-1252(-)
MFFHGWVEAAHALAALLDTLLDGFTSNLLLLLLLLLCNSFNLLRLLLQPLDLVPSSLMCVPLLISFRRICCPSGLLRLLLCQDSGVEALCQAHQLLDALHLLLLVVLRGPGILLHHPSLLLTAIGSTQVVNLLTAVLCQNDRISPGLEIEPKVVELLPLSRGVLQAANFWHRSANGESGVSSEGLPKNLEEVLLALFELGQAVIKVQA